MTVLAPAERPGWPRERLDFTTPTYDENGRQTGERTRKLPSVFLGGAAQRSNDWDTYDKRNSERCESEALCAVCGLGLEGLMLYGYAGLYRTNGPPVHPRCMAMALKFCPHFADRWEYETDIVAYAYYGRDPYVPVAPTERSIFGMRQPGEFRTPSLLGTYNLHADRVEPFTSADVLAATRETPLGVIPAWS